VVAVSLGGLMSHRVRGIRQGNDVPIALGVPPQPGEGER
jgi:hypothetical protein